MLDGANGASDCCRGEGLSESGHRSACGRRVLVLQGASGGGDVSGTVAIFFDERQNLREAIMNTVDANRLGVVGAVVMAAWHGIWVMLHATGQGQRVMDFVFRMHGLKSDAAVQPFDTGMAALLIVAAAVTGYVFLAAAGLVWNAMAAWCERSRTGVATRA